MKAILQLTSSLVLALGMIVVNSGCARVSAGHRIEPGMVSFIAPGFTTKQEVLENLGSPLLDLEGGQLIAYFWETTGQLSTSFSWFGREGGQSGPKQRQWIFCVAFDAAQRVTRHATITTKNGETVRDAALKWYAEGNGQKNDDSSPTGAQPLKDWKGPRRVWGGVETARHETVSCCAVAGVDLCDG